MEPPPDVPRERIVISFHCAVFTNQLKGILWKLVFADRHAEVFALGSQLCFFFLDHLQRSITDGHYVDLRSMPRLAAPPSTPLGAFTDPITAFLEHQQSVSAADFATVGRSQDIKGWTWHACPNALALDLLFADDHRSLVAFERQLCFYLLDYVREAITGGQFVDLRNADTPGPPS